MCVRLATDMRLFHAIAKAYPLTLSSHELATITKADHSLISKTTRPGLAIWQCLTFHSQGVAYPYRRRIRRGEWCGMLFCHITYQSYD